MINSLTLRVCLYADIFFMTDAPNSTYLRALSIAKLDMAERYAAVPRFLRSRLAEVTAGFQARKSSSVNPCPRASSDTKPL